MDGQPSPWMPAVALLVLLAAGRCSAGEQRTSSIIPSAGATKLSADWIGDVNPSSAHAQRCAAQRALRCCTRSPEWR